MLNEDVFNEIRAADSRAVASGLERIPFEIGQPLYVRANAFDVDIDAPISRICGLDNFLMDVRNGTLTHVRALASIWNDPLENPLYGVKYPEPISGGTLDLNQVVGDFYALCWTKEADESAIAWGKFAQTSNYVRLTTTPRKLLQRLMHREDNFYMMHHYIGEVKYSPPTAIEKWRDSTPYLEHLDSLGHGITASLTVIRDGFQDEQEVRLLYARMPHAGDWVELNVQADDRLARIPFDWTDVVDNIILCPKMTAKELISARQKLGLSGLGCPVQDSMLP